jgi:hypothetical protein
LSIASRRCAARAFCSSAGELEIVDDLLFRHVDDQARPFLAGRAVRLDGSSTEIFTSAGTGMLTDIAAD